MTTVVAQQIVRQFCLGTSFSGDANDLITRSVYDLSGLVISATDALGTETGT